MLLILATALVVSVTTGKLTFLAMGDWGGQGSSPYTTHEEVSTAKYMGTVATQFNASFGVGIGDNFYSSGVKNEYDPRFKETFEDVFTAHSLEFPWYMIAGNHDHYGNVTAEIYYSNHSARWNYPASYYTKRFAVPGTQRYLQIVLIDTVVLSGQTDDADWCVANPKETCTLNPTGPADPELAASQWTWLENELSKSTADYLIVMGHYPVWSIAEHGPTSNLVQKLRPMLEKYNVNAYFCGHDHTLEYLQEDGKSVGYVVTGGAHYCDPSTKHEGSVPRNSLKYHGCGDGGFVKVSMDDAGMQVQYFLGKGGNAQFQTPTFKPRK